MSIVVHCCPFLSTVVHCCPLLSIVVNCCPLLSIVAHCWILLRMFWLNHSCVLMNSPWTETKSRECFRSMSNVKWQQEDKAWQGLCSSTLYANSIQNTLWVLNRQSKTALWCFKCTELDWMDDQVGVSIEYQYGADKAEPQQAMENGAGLKNHKLTWPWQSLLQSRLVNFWFYSPTLLW